LRSGSPREEYTELGADALASLIEGPALIGLESFKIAFFLNGFDDRSYGCLDDAFAVPEWLGICRVPSSFISLLETFSEFLLFMIGENRLIFHPLLKLHTLTYLLSEELRDRDGPESQDVYRAVMGVHMAAARRVEDYLRTLTTLSEESQSNRLVFLSEGPLDEVYYTRAAPFFFQQEGLKIEEIRPHNSPVEIILQTVADGPLLVALALFLASRIQLEIRRLDRRDEPKKLLIPGQTPSEALVRPVTAPESLLSIYAGRGREDKAVLELRVKAMMPGSLLVDLGLDIGIPKLVGLRRIIVDLIRSDKRENPPD
jgi:hypothetical protein